MRKIKEMNSYEGLSPLCEIAKKYGTDKYQHGYTKIYYDLMKDKKDQNISIFEIGIYQGNSIKMWDEFFTNGFVCAVDNGRLLPNSNLRYSFDINTSTEDDDKLLTVGNKLENYDFGWIESDRIKCSISDQRSRFQLEKSFDHFGVDMFDFIIDDGHHFQEHQQKSLGILFKNIKPGGYYFIEDIVKIDGMIETFDNWGQKNRSSLREDYSDCTEYVFENFIKTGELKSEYLCDDQISYIESHVEDIHLFDHQNYNLRKNSQILVIKKK